MIVHPGMFLKAFQIGKRQNNYEINVCKLQSNMLHQIFTNIKTKLHNSGKDELFFLMSIRANINRL